MMQKHKILTTHKNLCVCVCDTDQNAAAASSLSCLKHINVQPGERLQRQWAVM